MLSIPAEGESDTLDFGMDISPCIALTLRDRVSTLPNQVVTVDLRVVNASNI